MFLMEEALVLFLCKEVGGLIIMYLNVERKTDMTIYKRKTS